MLTTEAAQDALQTTDGTILDVNLGAKMAFSVADALLVRGIPSIFATRYAAHVISSRFIHVKRCEKAIASEQIAAALFGRGEPRSAIKS